jgi:hypothetical protein
MAATGNITTDIRNGHTLTFRENPYHVYKLDDLKIPGGTDIKKAYPPSRALIIYYIKQGLDEFVNGWRLKKQADVGTWMHDYSYAKRMNQPIDLEPVKGHPDETKIRKRFAEVDKWVPTLTNEKLLAAEQIVANVCDFHKANPGIEYPECLCFAGKFDVLVEVNGKVRLQDYKSAKGFFSDQFIQQGGYAVAIESWLGIKVDELETIRFNDNTNEPARYCISDPKDVQEFKDEFMTLRKSRWFMKKWDTFFDKKYADENPYIKKK